MKRVWLAALLGMMSPLHVLADTAVRRADAKVLEAPPPRYPPEAARAGFAGTSVLLIKISETGQVTDVQVEQSAGHPALDAAAIDAARAWKFAPAIENGRTVVSRVRMPVDFGLGDVKFYDSFLAQMTAGDWVATVPVDEHGHLPGYLPDPQAIPGANVEEAVSLLLARANAQQVQGPPPGVALYAVADGKEFSQWWIHGQGASRSIVRRRLATDGRRGFLVTRVRCGVPDSHACLVLQAAEYGARPQMAIKLPSLQDAAPASRSP
ncbi:TonB family protein [Pseudoxanthomonas japonensis]|uniref:energy transducer TonB n=1 Tax=Pseudoxanthomonas TaxID=83618 RepID=UPI000784009E|nr:MULTISPECIES: energy transducer TonB [Pseudoxanthomonas]MDR7069300.1 TonB family protein [Pseudoxanthomonas japonensis]